MHGHLNVKMNDPVATIYLLYSPGRNYTQILNLYVKIVIALPGVLISPSSWFCYKNAQIWLGHITADKYLGMAQGMKTIIEMWRCLRKETLLETFFQF